MFFRFHIGSIKNKQDVVRLDNKTSFNSKLVRLKDFMKTVPILYAILVARVKLIFRITIFRVVLLSTSGYVNPLVRLLPCRNPALFLSPKPHS